ncbi:MAG: thioredoxin-disulfide reductase [Chloroflexi bacterium]|nr:thioredoxin-disulfide reductase [Chloroflexota bacterium]MBU1746646.1 thioredoxin-disulfide reductase [Chloroflexota bacterium]
MHEVIVIGSGPAGFTAAIYTARARLSTLILTGHAVGGQAGQTADIENYPGFKDGINGFELMEAMQEQAKRFEVEVVVDTVTAVDLSQHPFTVTTHDQEYQAQALVIATGATPRKLGVPGELEFIGRGVSYCATCDGFFYRDLPVAVVGGGNSALEETNYLTRLASKITVIHRRDRLRAEPILQERAERSGKVDFEWDTVVTAVEGDKSGVKSLRLRNVKTDEESSLTVDGVFVYVGMKPNTELFRGQLNIDEWGYIVTDRHQRTSVPGVFAAGDVQERIYPQVAVAVGTGAVAGMAADKFISEMEGLTCPERGTT